MAITKAKKQEISAKLADGLASAQSVVFVNFKGLSVALASELRRSLRQAGVTYYVAKKTLVKRALEAKGYEGTLPELPGELALAWSDDLIAPASGVYEYQKKTPEILSIVGGVFEGKYMDKTAMMEIATIPPLPVLHGKFVNIINSPIQRFVIALGAIRDQKNG
jgi:large subunit ribosomal protein L10